MDIEAPIAPASSRASIRAGVIQSESRRLRAESTRLRAALRAAIEQARRNRMSGTARPDATAES